MISEFLRKPLLRLPLFVLLSFPLRLMLDLGFSLVYRNYSLIRPLMEYVGAALITVIVLELAIIAKRRLNIRLPWENSPTRRLFLEALVFSVAFLPVIVALRMLTLLLLVKQQFVRFSDETLITIFYLSALVIFPAFAEFAFFLLNRWRIGLAEVERFKKENAEFQFETLRTQVNPHFLFNSLNTLSALVYEDKEKAAAFIRHLSDVFRYVLENRNRETIPLQQELTFIKAFVYLYQLRFDNKLKTSIVIDDEMKNHLIAPMTLQLLIENAVKHNIVSQKKPLTIEVFIEDKKNLVVKNNLQAKPAETSSTSIGLKNIVSRYAFLTDKPVEIIENMESFIVKIPLISQP